MDKVLIVDDDAKLITFCATYIVVAKIMFRYKDYLQRLGFRANPFGDI
jgi:hypothetical protein